MLYQDPFGSAWLNLVPSKNLGMKLTDQQLRISLSLRLGARICEKHTCRSVNLSKRTDIMVFPVPEAQDGTFLEAPKPQYSRETGAVFHQSSLNFGAI